MTGQHSNGAATNASRRAICLLGVACAAFILYGSLLPFNTQWHSLDQAWRSYLGLGSDGRVRLSLTDFATNFALFVPLARPLPPSCWRHGPQYSGWAPRCSPYASPRGGDTQRRGSH
jgi:hypothetical protein